ncbi:MAG: DUF881 domain-containing protein [Spirochaetaceae bacterium]|nr:DUF881 domain-containing protein [Spirochaetaceae bacterium]
MRAVWRLAAPVAFATAGVLFATSAGAARGGDLRGGSRSDLADLIRAEQRRADEVTRRVDRLRDEVQVATEQAGATDRRVAAEQRRSAGLELAAGTVAVVGPGLTVTLADAPRSADRVLPEDAGPDDLVVHQQDVQAVVNALWDGGAEAMRIMDQRVISTSAVRCVGNTLILQGRVYSPPYEITVIGNPERLRQTLDASPGVALYRYYVDTFGLVYETEDLARVRLPGYDGSLRLLYATGAA